MAGIKGVWQLKNDSDYDNLIAISFVGQTKLLKLIDEEVEETHLDGFQCSEQTLYCGNISQHGQQLILQATTGSIQLLSPKEGRVINEWKTSQNISLISTNEGQIICSSRSNLYYLEVKDCKIVLINECQMEYEASCVDISPLMQKNSKFCAVGLWKDISVRYCLRNGQQ